LFTAHCSLLTAHCPLLTVHCSLLIARYRKDKTGALDEVQIQQIQDEQKSLTEFAERKAFIEKTSI
jgi:hypothetical protein